MEVIDVLKKARKLLARKNGWIQRHYAAYRLKDGKLSFVSSRRNCFCITGALNVAELPDKIGSRIKAERELLKTIGRGETVLECWNDNPRRTQAQVVRAFDKTITRLAGSASR